MSLERQGGGQDLPAGQSVPLTCMGDTEDGPPVEQLLMEAVEAAAPMGSAQVEAKDRKASPESSSGLTQKAEDGLDKGSAHPSASTRQRRVRRDLPAVLVLVLAVFMSPLLGYLPSGLGVTDGFPVFDCSNRSSTVTAYSLIEPDTCRVTPTGLRDEKVLSTEIVQI